MEKDSGNHLDPIEDPAVFDIVFDVGIGHLQRTASRFQALDTQAYWLVGFSLLILTLTAAGKLLLSNLPGSVPLVSNQAAVFAGAFAFVFALFVIASAFFSLRYFSFFDGPSLRLLIDLSKKYQYDGPALKKWILCKATKWEERNDRLLRSKRQFLGFGMVMAGLELLCLIIWVSGP